MKPWMKPKDTLIRNPTWSPQWNPKDKWHAKETLNENLEKPELKTQRHTKDTLNDILKKP
jgi:hypothetical protein